MKMKFYRGQPVWRNGAAILLDKLVPEYLEPLPDIVHGLPNVWYQWDGGTEPLETNGELFVVQYRGSKCVLPCSDLIEWDLVEWYMIIKAPEVIK